MFLIKKFTFDCAHFLPDYKGKCEALHGHTYELAVCLTGSPAADGMIMDFTEFKQIVQDKVIDRLDHTCLNDFLTQPSAENLALWVWKELYRDLKRSNCALYEVKIWETKSSGAVYRGEPL